nr:MAG TPA: hypothetical protein [Caudoviricetes sp.]
MKKYFHGFLSFDFLAVWGVVAVIALTPFFFIPRNK